jgi:dihydroorotase
MSHITLLKNARLLDPATNMDMTGDLLIKDGLIAEIAENITLPKNTVPENTVPENTEIIDCDGKCLCPGLIDMRVFIGVPGADYKDTIQNTGDAAAAGGVTTVCVQPDTNPIIDNQAAIVFLESRAKDALVKFIPFPAVTKQLEGKEMTEIGLMSKAGIKAFTDCNKSIADAGLMSRIFKYASAFDALIIQHLEEPSLSNGCMNAGELATRLGLSGIPTAAEVIMLERDLRLLQHSPAKYHASQITCADSADVVKAAKAKGTKITASVSIPHIALNELAVAEYKTFAKVSPPLRGEDDRIAMVNALKNGTVDVIVSGHDPEDPESKRVPFEHAETGAIGLETLLVVALELYHNGQIELLPLLAKMTCNPAKILGLESGVLKKGAPADLCLFDIRIAKRIDKKKMISITKNTPFDGKPIQGQVLRTFVNGLQVFNHQN